MRNILGGKSWKNKIDVLETYILNKLNLKKSNVHLITIILKHCLSNKM